jgi:hypothetical protein
MTACGLSYSTTVRKTHQEAPPEAQPPAAVPDVLLSGKAWRGHLWISLLVAVAVFVGLRYLPQ